jgi:hypothetical protein
MGKRGSLPLVAMRWMIVSEWRTYPSRTVIAVLAIAAASQQARCDHR